MSAHQALISDLETLNQIAETLNRGVNVSTTLESALQQLVQLLGLETGWIFLKDDASQDRWGGRGFTLTTTCQLPPALALSNPEAWDKSCECQSMCLKGKLNAAYNAVQCSRLAEVAGDRHGLAVHASVPLRSGERILGILNVAATAWDRFDERGLALLANVGSQMGIALERARLFDLMQERRIHEQGALLNLSSQLLTRLDVADLLAYIVAEVAQMMAVDAAAILLPDEDPAWLTFQAAVGWHSDPAANGYRVLRQGSGSGQVMDSQQPLIWNRPQTGDDERSGTASNLQQWVRDEAFMAMAVAPMVVDGRSTGVLLIDHREPRTFNEGDIRFLRLMANQAAIALERARLLQEEIQRHRIEEELAVGQQIQLSMLPSQCPAVTGWDMTAFYAPARQVSGDFYDFIPLPNHAGRLGVVVADVSGKGVPAALFMVLSRTTIRNTVLRGHEPASALRWANTYIQQDSQTDMFLTAFYGALETENGRFTFVNAGHNRPLWWQAATQSIVELDSPGIVLGVVEEIELVERTITIAPGDVVVLFTDGVTEAMTAEYAEFGSARLHAVVGDLLAAKPQAAAEEIVAAIVTAVNNFTGSIDLSDDMTLVVMRRLEGA